MQAPEAAPAAAPAKQAKRAVTPATVTATATVATATAAEKVAGSAAVAPTTAKLRIAIEHWCDACAPPSLARAPSLTPSPVDTFPVPWTATPDASSRPTPTASARYGRLAARAQQVTGTNARAVCPPPTPRRAAQALVEAFPDAAIVVNEKKPRHKAFEVTLVQDGKAEPGAPRPGPSASPAAADPRSVSRATRSSRFLFFCFSRAVVLWTGLGKPAAERYPTALDEMVATVRAAVGGEPPRG